MKTMDSRRTLMWFVICSFIAVVESGCATTLSDAVWNGDVAAVNDFLNNGAAINGDKAGIPLLTAISRNRVDMVRLLLSKGANVNVKDSYGMTPLAAAVGNCNADIIRLLLDKGVVVKADTKINVFQNKFNNTTQTFGTVLSSAINSDCVDVVMFVLEKSSKENIISDLSTLLKYATKRGDAEMLRLLLTKGVTVIDFGENALNIATENGNVEMVRLLLETGTNVNAVNMADSWGNTPLNNAIEYRYDAVVRILLAKGADVNIKDRFGNTPFRSAFNKRNVNLMRLLIDNGADLKAKDSDGNTPLHLAATLGDADMIRQILAKNADINVKNDRGETAFHIAADNGHVNVIRMLLSNGADPGIANNKGRIPLMIAQAKNNTMIVKLLEEAELGLARQEASRAQSSAAISDIPVMIKSDIDELPSFKTKKINNAYAIVIGIETYRQKLPKADFAAQDAKIVSNYLTRVLGYPEENVVTLVNDKAAKSDFEKYFEKWLGNNVEKDGSVFVYYSGHGAPDPKSGSAYLVPYDGDPTFIDQTGYSLKRMYEALGKLPAKEITVALDSCFSGAGGRSVLAKGARPIVISVDNPALLSQKITVLSASSSDQVSSTYDEKGHGLFTYFMLKGIKNEDVIKPDGTLMLSDLFSYVKPQVERIARKMYNNEQTPQMMGKKQ